MKRPTLKFLRSDSAQSTMRVVVFMLAACVGFNLLALPVLLYFCIKSGVTLAWVEGYSWALGGIGGLGVGGKVLQKKFESSEIADPPPLV